MNEYVFGNSVRVTTTFLDINGNVVKPTLVYLTINKAGQFTLTYQHGVGAYITQQSTGVYYADLDLDIVGGWNYYWFSSGTLAAERGQLLVTPNGVD